MTVDFTAMLESDNIIIGRSTNSECPVPAEATPRGVISARTENFQINGVHFYDFDLEGMSAIQSCSGCEKDYTQHDSGARTVLTSSLQFTNVNLRIIYNIPYRAIYNDLDGTLTGLGGGSWATRYWIHNMWEDHCQEGTDVHQGSILCDNTV